MRVERALEVVARMAERQRRARARPFHRTTARIVPPARVYEPGPRPWAWASGNPQERANMVRQHYKIPGLTAENLCDLFNLTTNGLVEIIRGHDWRSEYERSA